MGNGLVATSFALGLPGFLAAEDDAAVLEERGFVRGQRKRDAEDDKEYRASLETQGLNPGKVRAKAGMNQALTADLAHDKMVVQQHLPLFRAAKTSEEKSAVLNGIFSSLSMGSVQGNHVSLNDNQMMLTNGEGNPFVLQAGKGQTLDQAVEGFLQDVLDPSWRQAAEATEATRKHEEGLVDRRTQGNLRVAASQGANQRALQAAKPLVLGAGQVAVNRGTGLELARGLPVSDTTKDPAVVQEAKFVATWLREDAVFKGASEAQLKKAAYQIATAKSSMNKADFVREMTLKAVSAGMYETTEAALKASQGLADQLYDTAKPAASSGRTVPNWRNY